MLIGSFFRAFFDFFIYRLEQTSIFWLPIILGVMLYHLWYEYKQAEYLKSTKWITLEIKIPKKIDKFPSSMEMVMNIFHQTFEGNWWTRLTQGLVRGWFSLELVSFAGEIHFYLRIQKFFKKLVESQIYSQYPEVEVFEVPDYTEKVRYGEPGSDLNLWGREFELSKPDPYPIKTYVDYHLSEKDATKEEFKVDPMTPVLELLGSLGPGEQIWIQILIQATKDRFPEPGKWFKKRDWKAEGQDLIKKLMKRDEKPKEGEPLRVEMLSPGEREVVAAVERSISKPGFDCGIRALYIANKDKFNTYNIPGLLSAWKQYSSANLNGFRPSKKYQTGLEFPWQDFRGIRVERMKRRMFDAYIRRSFFYPPYKHKPMVLNTEELATIYHFPGEVARTPTLEKIEAKKSEAPTNLPI